MMKNIGKPEVLSIAQSDARTYNEAHVIAEYLKPLQNRDQYIFRNTNYFSKLLQQQEPIFSSQKPKIHLIFVIRRVFCLCGIIKLNTANLYEIIDLVV